MHRTSIWIVIIIFALLLPILGFSWLFAAEAERFEIDTERSGRYLPYYFTELMFFDHAASRESVSRAVQVYQQSQDSSQAAQILLSKNSSQAVGEIASFLVKDMTALQVLSEDPIRMTLKDVVVVDGITPGDKYIVAAAMASDSAYVVRNIPGTNSFDSLFLTTGEDRSGDGRWSAGISIVGALDYDLDGSVEVFLSVTPGRDIRPRILICVQVEPFEIEWKSEISSVVGRDQIFFIPDANDPVVLFTSYGPQNGASDSLFDDYFGYFAGLNQRGEITFLHRILADYGHPALTSVDSTNRTFCFFHNLPLTEEQKSEADSSSHWLSLANAQGEIVLSRQVSGQPVSLWTCQQEEDGPLLIYSLWVDGSVRIFDQQLNLVSSSGASNLASYQGTLKIDGETEPVMVFGTRRGLELYSASFEMLALYEKKMGNLQPLVVDHGSVSVVTVSGSTMGGVLRINRRDRWSIFLTAFQEQQELVLTILALLAFGIVLTNVFRMRTATALRDRERTLSSLFDNMQDGFYRTDLKGRITWTSPSCAEMLGNSRDTDFIGTVVADIYVDPSKRQTLVEALEKEGSVTDWEVELRRLDGRVITVSTNSSYHYDSHGRVAGVEGVFRDITARKEMEVALRLSEEQYRTLVESAGESIFKVDRAGRYLFMNSVCAERLGGEAKDLIGKRGEDLSPAVISKEQMEAIGEVFETGTAIVMDYEMHNNEKLRVYNTSLQPILDDSGRVASVLGVSRDITELVRTRKSLATQEEFAGSLMDTASSLIACLDLDCRVLVFNRELERITGCKRSEVVGKRWAEVVEGTAGDCFEGWFADPARDQCECTITATDGERFTILWSRSTVKTPGYAESSVLIIGQDITDRKGAELALAHSEEKYRLLVQNVTATICLVDEDGVFRFMNEVGARLHNLPVEEIVGKSHWELFPKEVADYQVDKIRQVITSGQEMTDEAQSIVDNEWRWFRVNVQPYRDSTGQISCAMVIAHDVTESKQAEEHIRLLSSAVEQSSEGLAVVDLEGYLIVINEAFAQMHGYTPEELKGEHLSVFHTEEQLANVKLATDQILETGLFAGELWHARKDGTVFLGWMNNTLLRDESGKAIGIIGTLIDITDRKKTEETLRHRVEIEELVASISTEFINMPIELIDDGINDALRQVGLFIGADRGYLFKLTDDNHMLATHSWQVENVESLKVRAEKISLDSTPWWTAKLRALECVAITRPSDLPDEAATERQHLITHGTKSALAMPMVHQDRLMGLLSFSCVHSERDWPTEDIQMLRVIVEVFVNALEHKRKTIEAQRIHQERLGQERQVAGGFAHEIRNALFPARGMLEKLTESIKEADETGDYQHYSKMVDDSLTRAMGLVSSIMAYSRLGAQTVEEVVRVAAVVDDVLSSNQLRINELGAQIERKGFDDVTVLCNTQQLYMVLNNLLLNSLDAFDGSEQPKISLSWLASHDRVTIVVSDNGCGIKADKLNRIFEAFYSTKPDKGTGLGLATVKKIVAMYGGEIKVTSSSGVGTEMTLSFRSESKN